MKKGRIEKSENGGTGSLSWARGFPGPAVISGVKGYETAAGLGATRRKGIVVSVLAQLGEEPSAGDEADVERGQDAEHGREAHAALWVTSSDRLAGSGLPMLSPTRRRCANLDDGIPMLRQLCTVEIGASISLATAEVPPK